MTGATQKPLVLFDGVCNLCAWAVGFIIARDPGAKFQFASLQSPLAQRLAAQYGFPAATPESVVLIEDGRVYTESDAALRIARSLRWPWPLFSAARVIPRFVRDAVYLFVCRHRYRWFGKAGACLVPGPLISGRFLDS